MACCVAVGCSNRTSTKGLSFYRFPAKSSPERRQLWISALKRDGWLPTEHSRLCCQHFVSGKKSDHPYSPDYIPTIFKYTSSPQRKALKKKVEVFERRNDTKRKKTEQAQKSAAAAALLDLSAREKPSSPRLPESDPCPVDVGGTGTQTSLTLEDIKDLEETNRLLCSKQELQTSVREELSIDSFKGNNEKVQVFTGLSRFALLMQVLNLILPNLKERKTSLSPFHQLLLTLMRLRLNTTVSYLSYLFKVDHSAVVKDFSDVTHILNEKLVPLTVIWPERSEIHKTLPSSISVLFPKCISIIDCFEVFVEHSSNFDSKANTYSRYKSHNTVKYLVSVSPRGVVNFVSKGWEGHVSDKYLTENSGYLNMLLPGDTVLADGGFTVEDSVGRHHAKLEITAITKGKEQLDAIEVSGTKDLAAVTAHIHQVLGKIRKKYSFLDSIIPETLLQTTLDKIVKVICGLTNICELESYDKRSSLN